MRKLALAAVAVAGTLFAAQVALGDVAPPRRPPPPPPPAPPPAYIPPPPPVVLFQPWYFSISGHYAWADFDDDFDFHHHHVNRQFDNGFSIYGAIGYRFGPWFALEVEAGYLSISGDTSADFFGRGRGSERAITIHDNDLSGMAIFANAVLTWPAADWIAPYIGAGVGGFFSFDDEDFIVARHARSGRRPNPQHASDVFTRGGSDSDFSFAFQAKAGIDFRIWPGVTIGPEYRFTWIDVDRAGNRDDGGSLHIHAVGATLKFNF